MQTPPMRRMKLYILTLLTALAFSIEGSGAPPKGWETVKSELPESKPVVKDTEFEVRTLPGSVVVISSHQVQIKIFTILGRLVNSETLPPGTSRLLLPAHGVYIVKIGDVTCKIAV